MKLSWNVVLHGWANINSKFIPSSVHPNPQISSSLLYARSKHDIFKIARWSNTKMADLQKSYDAYLETTLYRIQIETMHIHVVELQGSLKIIKRCIHACTLWQQVTAKSKKGKTMNFHHIHMIKGLAINYHIITRTG